MLIKSAGLQDLEEALTASNATWKVVVGHHPISSGCEHGNTTELREYLLPVLKVAIFGVGIINFGLYPTYIFLFSRHMGLTCT